MSSPIIEVENLGKSYRLGKTGAGSLREELERFWQRRRSDTADSPSTGEFWALRNVSFSLDEGEVLGVIGPNGAGKSTLLKLLSRITEPTEGRAILRGRVASLLEVGTGFHQELSGRENIFLNGAVLGMTRREVLRKFDEIVEFSGVEKFLDTPVKRYSSGMRVRLGFAVAAHLEPEILIVDEVLAVGDVSFQKRCLGKMRDVSQSGRTVLFVSHSMSSINALCGRCLILRDGNTDFDGGTPEAVQRYQMISLGNPLVNPERRIDSDIIETLVTTRPNGEHSTEFCAGDTVVVRMRLGKSLRMMEVPIFGIGISDEGGDRMTTVATSLSVGSPFPIEAGDELVCRLPDIRLAPGEYFAKIFLRERRFGNVNITENLPLFRVVESDYFGSGELTGIRLGKVMQRSVWTREETRLKENLPGGDD